MSVPTGAGNYPPGVTDNDPHFGPDEEREPTCGEIGHDYQPEPGAPSGYACAICGALPPEGWYPEPDTELGDEELLEIEERVDPQTGYLD